MFCGTTEEDAEKSRVRCRRDEQAPERAGGVAFGAAQAIAPCVKPDCREIERLP